LKLLLVVYILYNLHSFPSINCNYRRALPFFFGLVVGEFTAGFIRTVVDLAFDLYLPVDSGIGGL
jgi:hypothetical protein